MTRQQHRTLSNLGYIYPGGFYDADILMQDRHQVFYPLLLAGLVELFSCNGVWRWRVTAAGMAALKEERESGRKLEA